VTGRRSGGGKERSVSPENHHEVHRGGKEGSLHSGAFPRFCGDFPFQQDFDVSFFQLLKEFEGASNGVLLVRVGDNADFFQYLGHCLKRFPKGVPRFKRVLKKIEDPLDRLISMRITKTDFLSMRKGSAEMKSP